MMFSILVDFAVHIWTIKALAREEDRTRKRGMSLQ